MICARTTCGTEWEPATRRGRPRFCSEACRRAYWLEQRRQGAARGPRKPRAERQASSEARTEVTSATGLERTLERTTRNRKGRRPVAVLAPLGEAPVRFYFTT